MKIRFLIFLILSPAFLFAQVNTNFTQFFINPYIYNPSYAGADAQSALFLSYRNQWTGFEGAPTVANASFHAPAGKNVGVGINIFNEQKSILQSTSALLSFSYAVPLGVGNYLRFGISGGGAFNGVDINEIPDDPVYSDIMENNLYLVGNAGVSLQIKTFQLGIAAPNLFTEDYITTENFTVGEIEPMEQLLISASNRFYFANGRHIFEPVILYRYSDILPTQLEAAAVVHLNHTVWFGGSYKEDFGVSALGGFKINKKFGVGYSYSLATSGINEINRPTHEVHISILLGEKIEDRLAFSFINSEKEKKKPKRRPPIAKKEEPVKEEPKAEEPVEEEEEIEEEVREEVEDPIIVTPQDPEEVETEEEPVEEVIEEKEDEQASVTPGPQVVVKKGDHLLELQEGNYVVVGAFSSYENAEKFSDQLFAKGYPTKFGYTSEKGYWYVYLFQSDDLAMTRQERDRARQKDLFSKAWVLTVEE